jgi:hypothetical protein
MISPTDLFHPSPAPHFKTFQERSPKLEEIYNKVNKYRFLVFGLLEVYLQ